MRLIAERLLPEGTAGTTYVDRELASKELRPLPPPAAEFHVFCSALNPGALELMDEVEHARLAQAQSQKLALTTDVSQLARSDCFLLYLASQTWTRGAAASAALEAQLVDAMGLGVRVLLAHEMPGMGGQEARFACEFSTFFSSADGSTPGELLRRGIYSTIAVPLKGGPWRETSKVLLAIALGMSKEDVAIAKEDGNYLGRAAEAHVTRFRASFKASRSMLFSQTTKLAMGSSAVLLSRERVAQRRGRVSIRKLVTSTSTTSASAAAAEGTIGGLPLVRSRAERATGERFTSEGSDVAEREVRAVGEEKYSLA